MWFSKAKTRRCFRKEIDSGIISLNDSFEEQINLKYEIDKLKKSAKPKNSKEKKH